MASEFVDALCDPPERFQYGAVLAHILTFSAYRRQLAFAALTQTGRDIGYGDRLLGPVARGSARPAADRQNRPLRRV